MVKFAYCGCVNRNFSLFLHSRLKHFHICKYTININKHFVITIKLQLLFKNFCVFFTQVPTFYSNGHRLSMRKAKCILTCRGEAEKLNNNDAIATEMEYERRQTKKVDMKVERTVQQTVCNEASKMVGEPQSGEKEHENELFSLFAISHSATQGGRQTIKR